MAIITIDEIPTVSQLYQRKELESAILEAGDEAPTPNQSFNDKICVIKADITKLEVDAIVNAANNSLLGGGGVDGAIHRAAGDELLFATRKLGGCDTGSAKITGAFKLPCKKVIHAVGPVYYHDAKTECEEDLASCYTTSLELAVQNGCKSIAFSALSTGVYGYPSSAAAEVAIQAVKAFLEGENGDSLEKVIFVTFMPKDVRAYNELLPRYFPPTEPKSGEPEQAEKEPVKAESTKAEASESEAAKSTDAVATKVEAESDWEEQSAENGPQRKDTKATISGQQKDVETGDEVGVTDMPTTQSDDEEGHTDKKMKTSKV